MARKGVKASRTPNWTKAKSKAEEALQELEATVEKYNGPTGVDRRSGKDRREGKKGIIRGRLKW